MQCFTLQTHPLQYGSCRAAHKRAVGSGLRDSVRTVSSVRPWLPQAVPKPNHCCRHVQAAFVRGRRWWSSFEGQPNPDSEEVSALGAMV
jgi:hypothetical protein